MSNGVVDLTRTNVNGFHNFVTEFGNSIDTIENFISSTSLGKTELIWNFLSMVEFSGETIDGITPLDFSSNFAINMLKAFEEFDNLEPKGLITQQFTALAQKCADKGVKLLIGENPNNKDISVNAAGLIQNKYIRINFSEELVKQRMKGPVYIIQQKSNNGPEIKAIPLGNLVARTMVADFDDSNLVAKCAAYLLFHELFHVNSFYFEFAGDGTLTDPENFKKSHKFPENVKSEDIDLLIDRNFQYDDFRNVTGAKTETETRVPGEYELLQALYPDKKIMRLYEGPLLNFSNSKVLAAAVNVARFENNCLNSKSNLQQNLNNRYLSWELEKILNDKKIQFNKIELNDIWIQASFEDEYNKLANINTQLKSYIQMEATKIKVDTGVWEAQANLYIENINKILEKAEMKKNTLKKAYIPC